MFVDSFTSLDDVPARQHGDPRAILSALKAAKRFSCWDVDGAPRLWATIKGLEGDGLITLDNYHPKKHDPLDPGKPRQSAYPWTLVVLTESGERLLARDGSSQNPSHLTRGEAG